ncbi:MAG: nucleotidyltransferase family protein [Colwellia sp.]
MMESTAIDKPFILTESSAFEDLVRALNESGSGYLAIVNAQNSLIGIFTDADLRHAVLNKQFNIEEVINRKPKVLPASTSRRMVINQLKKLRRRHMPLVDAGGVYAGVVSLDDLEFNIKPNTVVIMAGGLGSRMGELTKETPKPMLKVGDKPVLERIIEHFADHGFTKFLISVNYKKEVIMDYFGNGYDFGVNIKYIEEKKRLGTAGALSLIDECPEEDFFVVNGDVLTSLNYTKLLSWHESNSSQATMCVREFKYQVPYGVVEFDDSFNIDDMKEKPLLKNHVNAGIYVISPKILEYVPKETFYDMPTFFTEMKEKGSKLIAYVVSDYWIDIGMKEQYNQANYDFKPELGECELPLVTESN